MGQVVVYPATTGKGLFDGTNGTALPTYDANWHNPNSSNFNDCAIRGTPGVGASGASSEAILNGVTLNTDQFCQITLDQSHLADSHFYIKVRMPNDTTAHGYEAGYNPIVHVDNRYVINVDGVEQVSSAQVATFNDVMNLQAVGTLITLTVNGLTVLTASAATYNSGFAGLSLDDRSGTNPRLAGLFTAGNITTGSLFTATNPMTGQGVGGPFFANPLG